MADESAPFNVEAAWEAAEKLYNDGQRAQARDALLAIVAAPVEADNPDAVRCKEQAVYRLGELLAVEKRPAALIQLLTDVRGFFGVLPKAKTTKIVRKLFDCVLLAGASVDEQLAVARDMVAWARSEKRTFLRHRLQHRLAQALFDRRDTREALSTVNALLREARRLDDRTLLVDVHLLESRIYHSIKNASKARAALVAARTNANAIYCPPLAQAEIDMQSGILHAEERDNKTAYSYLYEAFEGFHSLGDHAVQARQALRYMVVAKIATTTPGSGDKAGALRGNFIGSGNGQDELNAVLMAKNVLEYRGRDMDALRGIADAYKRQDTHAFAAVLERYADVLGLAPSSASAEGAEAFVEDETLRRQLQEMQERLMERHLLRLIAPYTRVELAHLAAMLRVPVADVEARVSQMILDKKLRGIVDQQHACLVAFDEDADEALAAAAAAAQPAGGVKPMQLGHAALFADALEALEALDKLVTALFDKAAGKFDKAVEERLAARKAGAKKPDADKKAKNEADKAAEEKKDKK